MFYGKKFMDRMGWSQQDFAGKLGCAQSRISDLNSGTRDPKYSEIIKLIELGITLEELFGPEVAARIKSSELSEQDFTKSPEFQEGVMQAAIAAQEALLASLKARKI